jgi:P4 family phage/plasmid primase-like protien
MTVWSQLPLTAEHATYLRDQAAITAEVAQAAGIRSATSVDELPEWAQSWGEQAVPAIVFPWRSPAGVVVEQVRPDEPVVWDGEPHKYLWPRGESSILNAVRPDPAADTVLVVEGTKQGYAAASWAPAGVAVYAIGGCRNWSSDGVPVTDLAVAEGRKVVVALDADATTNAEVYAAGLRIGEAVRAEGARSVAYVRLPASGAAGLDDVLAKRAPDTRTAYLGRLIGQAKPKPAETRPRAKDRLRAGVDTFFEDGALLVDRLCTAIRDRMPAALTEEQRVALYRGGVFHIDRSALIGAVAEMLGDRFRPAHRSTVEEYMVGVLFNLGLFLPACTTDSLLNVKNGMLDLATGTLKPHDPAYLSSQQIPVEWDPDATCPTYDAWVESCGIIDQLPDLEETTSTMLDPSRTPPKSVFLFGPSRSGKSTFLRLMQAMIGPANLSAVTLHQLSQNRFAAANVFGKMLNCAADLSSAHVDDISIFKMMTGEDPIQADRKYGGQFAFTNKALFAFSANELPTVGESSRAYTERIKPFEFAITFAGHENPELERRMVADELPGILVRWVKAWQRRHQRGTYLPTDPRVMHEFEVRSDRVRQWLDDRCVIWRETADGQSVSFGTTVDAGRASTKAELAAAFNHWAEQSNGAKMGQRKIIDRLMTVPGVTEVRRLPAKTRAINVTVRKDVSGAWEGDGDPTPSGGSFEGPSGNFGGLVAIPVAVSAPELPPQTPWSGAQNPVPVAGVAISSPPCPTPKPPRAGEVTEGDLEGGISGVGQGRSETATSATSATAKILARPDLDRVEKALAAAGVEQLDLLAPSPAVDQSSAYPTVEIRELDARGAVTLPEGVVALDIETASEEQLWARGPEFVRLCGYQTGDRITLTSDANQLARIIEGATLVIGHNVMAFDLVAFARNYGVDLMKLAADGRVFDTKLAAILNDPPTPGSAQAKIQREYSLDNLGARLLGATKTGDLKALAKEHGGYDQIPLDDERYARYLVGDVDLTARLAGQLRTNPYVRREHRVAAIAAQIRLSGFRVDVPELECRVVANRDARAKHLEQLAARYGLPTTKKDGKPSRSPHATAEGKAAIVQAFTDLGVELPKTEKGAPSFGKLALARVAEQHADRDEVMALVELVSSLNGVRTVYETVLAHLHGDRVHPEIGLFQASGRWSTTKPGLTVMGKRGGKYAEREVFLPEPGHVIISADLAQVDARAIAALSQDPAYLAMFGPGLDLHREVATRVWGDPGRRDDAKAIGHGWNYGMGIAGLARNAKVSEDVAREFDRAMREQFPGLIAWRDGVRADGEVGRLLDNGFGRLMRVDPNRAWTQAPGAHGPGLRPGFDDGGPAPPPRRRRADAARRRARRGHPERPGRRR